MKYKLTRNSIINGVIYPRGTIIPNKKVELEGTWVNLFIKDKTLVLIDDNIVKTQVVNMEDKMRQYEEENKAEQEKEIKPEPIEEEEQVPVQQFPIKIPEEKKINKKKKAGRPKKTKTEVV